MAKAAKFDRTDVINKATLLYWEKGFHATSMRNLQDEIDMRPGSIYAAFGNKDGLFKETLRHYTDMGLAKIITCRQLHSSPLKALNTFVKTQVIDTQGSAPNGICMLAKTMGELTHEHQELLDTTKDCLAEINQELANLVEEAQTVGEVDKAKNAQDLASHLQIQITGLRTYAKLNNDQAKLERIINDIFTHYPFK